MGHSPIAAVEDDTCSVLSRVFASRSSGESKLCSDLNNVIPFRIAAVPYVCAGVRHAIRRLRHDTGLALRVTLTLALAVGINSAIFSIVNGLHVRCPFET